MDHRLSPVHSREVVRSCIRDRPPTCVDPISSPPTNPLLYRYFLETSFLAAENFFNFLIYPEGFCFPSWKNTARVKVCSASSANFILSLFLTFLGESQHRSFNNFDSNPHVQPRLFQAHPLSLLMPCISPSCFSSKNPATVMDRGLGAEPSFSLSMASLSFSGWESIWISSLYPPFGSRVLPQIPFVFLSNRPANCETIDVLFLYPSCRFPWTVTALHSTDLTCHLLQLQHRLS